MYYPCSENKGADQLHGYREADLCLCFRIYMQKASFLRIQLIFVPSKPRHSSILIKSTQKKALV